MASTMASTIRASLVHQRRRSDPAMNSSSSSSSPSDGLSRRRSILRHYVRYAFLSFIMLMSSLSFLSYHDKYFSRQTYERLSPTQHPVKSEVPEVKTKTKKKKLKKKRILGQPPTIVSRWPTSHDLTDFVTGPAAPYYNNNNRSQLVFPTMAHNNNQSVCEFRDISYSFHFPHAMQQLLRCFSWWHANRHQRPVLVLPATHAQYSYTSAFLQALRDIWKVQVFFLPKDDKAERPLRAISATVQTNNGKTPFQMTSLQDAQVLRDGIQQYYHLLDNKNDTLPTTIKTITHNNNNNSKNHQSTTTTMAPPGCPTPNQDNKSMPVVGFLNRQGGRRVTNYQAILQALNLTSAVYYLDSFDHTTFLQQAAFMSHMDILIGPHGAQLTSAFLQPTCGGVLELFPKGLFWTSFFGTLATTTGHHHAALYTGGALAKQQNETKYYQSTLELRVQSRNFPIHADPPAVVQQVEQLIQQWRACCDSMYVDVEEEEVEEE